MRLFTPIGFLLLLLSVSSISIKAQSLQSLFLSLPSKCTPHLKNSDRNILIKEGEYEFDGRKEEDEIDYTLDTVTDNYLAYEYSSGKGQGINVTYEIKKFKMNTGKSILLFAKNSDSKDTSNKYDLKIYNISPTGSLSASKEILLPQNLNYSVFLKNDVPESVKTSIEKTSLCTFDLDITSNDKIAFYIIPGKVKDEQWLAGNIMILTWTGSTFTGTISFQKEE
jgi:hypothetical protein